MSPAFLRSRYYKRERCIDCKHKGRSLKDSRAEFVICRPSRSYRTVLWVSLGSPNDPNISSPEVTAGRTSPRGHLLGGFCFVIALPAFSGSADDHIYGRSIRPFQEGLGLGSMVGFSQPLGSFASADASVGWIETVWV